MQITKKMYTTFIITVLTLSMLIAAIPMVSAIASAPSLTSPGTTVPLTSGSVGFKVQVNGIDGGAGDASPFSTVTVYWDNLSGKVLGTVTADPAGAYAINVTIPSAVTGPHFIIVNDGYGAYAATFTVKPSVSASITPSTGPTVRALPGDSVTLTCHGFAANSVLDVRLIGPYGTLVLPVAPTTNGTGSIDVVIVIPATITPPDFGTYTVAVTDSAPTPSVATSTIVVDYYIRVMPPAGPSGIIITMSGRIPASTPYEIRIDSTTILTGTSDSDSRFSQTYVIPPLIALGGHTIYVVWEAINFRGVPFLVTAPPVLTSLVPSSGYSGNSVITISGSGFSAYANITLTIGTTVVNSTALDDRFGPTDGPGFFDNLEFTVPEIMPGIYVLTVTDQYGASTGSAYTFQVRPSPIVINNYASTTTSRSVTLTLTYPGGGEADEMRFKNEGESWTAWEPYATSKTWNLTSGSGVKKVYVEFYPPTVADVFFDTIILEPFLEELAFDVIFEETVYVVGTCSNSSVTDLTFNQALKRLRLNVDGTSGTTGFCNITIPADLMWGDFSIFIDDTPLIEDVDYTETYNGTHYLFSISYEHSSHIIEIISTNVVPDFAGWLFLPFVMSATLLVLVLKKRLKKYRKFICRH